MLELVVRKKIVNDLELKFMVLQQYDNPPAKTGWEPFGGDRYYVSHVVVTLPEKTGGAYRCEFHLIPATTLKGKNLGHIVQSVTYTAEMYREKVSDDKWRANKVTHAFPVVTDFDSRGDNKNEKKCIFFGFSVRGNDCFVRTVNRGLVTFSESLLDVDQAVDYGLPIEEYLMGRGVR
jgi:hypothetical protein